MPSVSWKTIGIAVAIAAVLVFAAWGISTQGGDDSTSVSGTVVEKHVEQKNVTYIKAGSVILPTGGGAKYVVVVAGANGGAVTVSARVWASVKVGDSWPEGSQS